MQQNSSPNITIETLPKIGKGQKTEDETLRLTFSLEINNFSFDFSNNSENKVKCSLHFFKNILTQYYSSLFSIKKKEDADNLEYVFVDVRNVIYSNPDYFKDIFKKKIGRTYSLFDEFAQLILEYFVKIQIQTEKIKEELNELLSLKEVELEKKKIERETKNLKRKTIIEKIKNEIYYERFYIFILPHYLYPDEKNELIIQTNETMPPLSPTNEIIPTTSTASTATTPSTIIQKKKNTIKYTMIILPTAQSTTSKTGTISSTSTIKSTSSHISIASNSSTIKPPKSLPFTVLNSSSKGIECPINEKGDYIDESDDYSIIIFIILFRIIFGYINSKIISCDKYSPFKGCYKNKEIINIRIEQLIHPLSKDICEYKKKLLSSSSSSSSSVAPRVIQLPSSQQAKRQEEAKRQAEAKQAEEAQRQAEAKRQAAEEKRKAEEEKRKAEEAELTPAQKVRKEATTARKEATTAREEATTAREEAQGLMSIKKKNKKQKQEATKKHEEATQLEAQASQLEARATQLEENTRLGGGSNIKKTIKKHSKKNTKKHSKKTIKKHSKKSIKTKKLNKKSNK